MSVESCINIGILNQQFLDRYHRCYCTFPDATKVWVHTNQTEQTPLKTIVSQIKNLKKLHFTYCTAAWPFRILAVRLTICIPPNAFVRTISTQRAGMQRTRTEDAVILSLYADRFLAPKGGPEQPLYCPVPFVPSSTPSTTSMSKASAITAPATDKRNTPTNFICFPL